MGYMDTVKPRPGKTLGIYALTVTAASGTLTALFAAAGITVPVAPKALTLQPAGDVFFAYGEDAVLNTKKFASGSVYDLGHYGDSLPDIRFIAAGDTELVVIEEG